MRNPTLSDVAKAAGVSYATADRVINARGNVAEKSIRKVSTAMKRLGYVRDIAAANLSRGRVYRLVFLLPSGPNAFFAKMRDALDAQATHLAAERIDLTCVDVPAFSIDALRGVLSSLDAGNVDGVAVVGLSGLGLDAPLAGLRDKGLAVVSLVSDLPHTGRDAYVGINNLAAGRTAARLLAMAHRGQSGRIMVLSGSMEAEDHSLRVRGFRQVIEADFAQLEVLDPVLTGDNKDAVLAAIDGALAPGSEITAIYNAGAGNSGLVHALRLRTPDPALLCVVHELVPHSREALESGLIQFVIDQRPDIEVARAVSILRALVDGRAMPPLPELVPMIYVPDNLPSAFESPTVKVPVDD